MPSGGMLSALYAFHSHDIPRALLALTFLLVVFNCLSSFQIYSMPVFDSFEAGYTSRTNRPCSIWVRSGFRVFYGFVNFFIGVALPFLSSLAGLLGGLTLPVTFAYPCFMWVLIKQPTKYSFNWYFHWILGWMGIALSLALSIGGVWSMVNSGLKFKFFKPTWISSSPFYNKEKGECLCDMWKEVSFGTSMFVETDMASFAGQACSSISLI